TGESQPKSWETLEKQRRTYRTESRFLYVPLPPLMPALRPKIPQFRLLLLISKRWAIDIWSMSANDRVMCSDDGQPSDVFRQKLLISVVTEALSRGLLYEGS